MTPKWYPHQGTIAFDLEGATVASRDTTPSGEGVQFELNGVINNHPDRPNGYDNTGPLENSHFHWWDGTYYAMQPGDRMIARGETTEGTAFQYEYAVPMLDEVEPPTWWGIDTDGSTFELFRTETDRDRWKLATGR